MVLWWASLDLNQRPHPQVKIPGRGGNYLVLTTVDADPALSAEQSRPKGRVVLPIFIRQGWPQAMNHLSAKCREPLC